jgi:hypothetical protein
MHFYIDFAYLALSLVFILGFCVGRLFFVHNAQATVEQEVGEHYLAQYNKQMQELCTRYNQERVAMIHRYENMVVDLELQQKSLQNFGNATKTEVVTVASVSWNDTLEDKIA